MVTGIMEARDINQIIVNHVVNYKCDISCEETLVTGRWWSSHTVRVSYVPFALMNARRDTVRDNGRTVPGQLRDSRWHRATLAGGRYDLYAGCRALIAIRRSLNSTRTRQ